MIACSVCRTIGRSTNGGPLQSKGGSSVPNRSQLLYYNRGLVDTVGVSFSGTVMTLGPECPFLGVGPFVDGGVYDLANYLGNNSDLFWVMVAGVVGKLIVYADAQSDDISLKVNRFIFHSPVDSYNHKYFDTRYNCRPSTLIYSKKMYPPGVSAGASYTLPAGAEVSFDGVNWLAANGSWPSGADWWMCRCLSSTSWESSLDYVFTVASETYRFTVKTSMSNYIGMIETSTEYTIENDYYVLTIPKRTENGRGIIKTLKIKKRPGLSNNLLFVNGDFGLGYLEGGSPAYVNGSVGITLPTVVVSIVENTFSSIKIRSFNSYNGNNYTEDFTFLSGDNCFYTSSEIVRVALGSQLTNQYQMCWMRGLSYNDGMYAYGYDGELIQFNGVRFCPSHFDDKFQFIALPFASEGVSLGIILTGLTDPVSTQVETGDWPFEIQLDTNLGGGSLCSPIVSGDIRRLNTVYVTDKNPNYNATLDKSVSLYSAANKQEINVEEKLSSAFVNNAFSQNPGHASALVHSPYFLMRQNGQNTTQLGLAQPQYFTAIYGPLYKEFLAHNQESYNFEEQLQFRFEYDDGLTVHQYGTVSSSEVVNTGSFTSIKHTSVSDDGNIIYTAVWSADLATDKLNVLGSVKNNTNLPMVKRVSLILRSNDFLRISQQFLASTALESSSITTTLNGTDNKWTSYDYNLGYMSLIYNDLTEVVPKLTIPTPGVSGYVHAFGKVRRRVDGGINYTYSGDGVSYQTINVASGSNSSVDVDLGIVSLSGNNFYIGDDGQLSGANGWAGWDFVNLYPVDLAVCNYLGAGIYDFPRYDTGIGNTGMAVKINNPSISHRINTVSGGVELVIDLVSNNGAESTNFDIQFNIDLLPHDGIFITPDDYSETKNIVKYITTI